MAVTPALSQIVEALDATGWAIEVLDERWNVVWASSEMRLILGAEMGADLGLDRHVVASRRLTAYEGIGHDSGPSGWPCTSRGSASCPARATRRAR